MIYKTTKYIKWQYDIEEGEKEPRGKIQKTTEIGFEKWKWD